jgi:transcriptional regulator with XRE-family HTH domain
VPPYDAAAYNDVMSLLGDGLRDRDVAARTGVKLQTVRRWRRVRTPPRTVLRSELAEAWRVTDAAAYCYLLGVYLGDGSLGGRPPDGVYLQIVNDRQYASISTEILAAMAATFPGRRPRSHPSSAGASDVLCICHPAIGRAFPQHGPGRKHLRPIELTNWQRELTHAHPGALIRGLIHSDGCRVLNRFKTRLPSGRVAEYSYVRYFFSNLSGDIRRIFIQHCELLGIRVTQSNHRNLTVSHRDSVAILEELVGAKA